ncbi:MAG: MFS transporter, partial [Planctomycetaceae bacterium]
APGSVHDSPAREKPIPGDNEQKSRDALRDPWSLLKSRNLWLLTLSYAAYGYFQYLFFYWLGYYFKDELQIPPGSSRWASFWITLGMGAGMAFGGRITDIASSRLGLVRGRRAVVLAGMGLGAVFGIIAVNVDSFAAVAVCMAIAMASVGMCEGVFWTTATDIGGQSRGLSGAFMNTGGNIGGLISPVLSPVMAESLGWPKSIAVACCISGLGGAVWLLITPPVPNTENQ